MIEDNYNLHINLTPDTPKKTRGLKSILHSIFGGRKVGVNGELILGYKTTKLFKRSLGKVRFVKSQKEIQKLLKNPNYVLLPIRDIKDPKEAATLKPNEIVVANTDDLSKWILNPRTMKRIDELKSCERTMDFKLFAVKQQIEGAILNFPDVKEFSRKKTEESMIPFYKKMKQSLIEKWSAIVEGEVLKKANALETRLPRENLSKNQLSKVIDERLGETDATEENRIQRKKLIEAENYVWKKATAKEKLTFEDLCHLNRIVAEEEGKVGIGSFRENRVLAGGFCEYVSYKDVPALMTDVMRFIDEGLVQCEKGKGSPIVLAALARQRIASIQPFSDGNKRTSQLVMDYILMRSKLPPCIVDKKDGFLIFGEQGIRLPKETSPSQAVEKTLTGIERTVQLLKA